MRVSVLAILGVVLAAVGWAFAWTGPGPELQSLLRDTGPAAEPIAKLAAMPDRVIALGYVLFLGGLIRSGFRSLFEGH